MAITKKARENAYIGLYKAVGKYVELQGGRAPGRQDGRMSSKRGAVSGPSPHHPKSGSVLISIFRRWTVVLALGVLGLWLAPLNFAQGIVPTVDSWCPHTAMRLHNVGLFFDSPQGLVDEPAGYSTNYHKKPVWDVCRGQQFTPWILGRFFGGLFLIVCAMLAIDYDNWFGRIGGFLFVLGFVVLAAPVPWDLGPCPVNQTQTQQTEYRQTSEHGGNVPQIPRLETVGSGRIAGMGFFGKHVPEGVTHLTYAVLFKLIGVDALISSSVTIFNGQMERGTAVIALPLPFSWQLFGALFLALAIFYAVTRRFQIPPIVKIRSAQYGNSEDNAVSVEKYLNSYPKNAIVLQVDNNVLDGLPDPSPSIPPKKTLTVRYSFGNKTVWETSAEEGEWIALPAPASRRKRIS